MKTFKQYIMEDYNAEELENKVLALLGLKASDLGIFYTGNRGSEKARVKYWKWSPNDRITVGLKCNRRFAASLTVSFEVDSNITKVLSKPFVILDQTDFDFGVEKDDFQNVANNFIAGGKYFNEICDLVSANFGKSVNEIKKIVDNYSKKLNKSVYKVELSPDGNWIDLTLHVLPKNMEKKNWIPYFFVIYRTDKNKNIIEEVQEKCISSQMSDDGVESMNKIFNNLASDLKTAADTIKKVRA